MAALIIHSSMMIAGFVLLILGAQWLVKGGTSLALRFGIPPLFIGLTVVAVGTSTPELVVSLGGALQGKGDVSVGNVVGSNIFNIAAILGITAMITPIRVSLSVIKLDIPVMVAVSIVAFLLFQFGASSVVSGVLLLAALFGYIFMTLSLAKKEKLKAVTLDKIENVRIVGLSMIVSLLVIVIGILSLILGANIVVKSATNMALTLGISQAVISLTILGIGTSMPELVTSIVAALKHQPDMAIGNVVGSNIFNILGVLGSSSLITPLTAPGLKLSDWIVMLFVSVLLLPLASTGMVVDRREGGFFVVLYGIYFWWLWRGSFG